MRTKEENKLGNYLQFFSKLLLIIVMQFNTQLYAETVNLTFEVKAAKNYDSTEDSIQVSISYDLEIQPFHSGENFSWYRVTPEMNYHITVSAGEHRLSTDSFSYAVVNVGNKPKFEFSFQTQDYLGTFAFAAPIVDYKLPLKENDFLINDFTTSIEYVSQAINYTGLHVYGDNLIDFVGYVSGVNKTNTQTCTHESQGICSENPILKSGSVRINHDFAVGGAINGEVIFPQMQTTNGGDTSVVRTKKVDANTFHLMIEEEKSKDDEVKHTYETVSYITSNKNTDIINSKGEIIGEIGVVTANHNFSDIVFKNAYLEPIVIAKMQTYNGSQPATVSTNDFRYKNSFSVKVNEWKYLDIYHAKESIGYMVVEAGSHILPDGQKIVAFMSDGATESKFITKKYQANGYGYGVSFSSIPTVLTQVISDTDNTRVLRIKDVGLHTFSLKLQSEESLYDPHTGALFNIIAIGK